MGSRRIFKGSRYNVYLRAGLRKNYCLTRSSENNTVGCLHWTPLPRRPVGVDAGKETVAGYGRGDRDTGCLVIEDVPLAPRNVDQARSLRSSTAIKHTLFANGSTGLG